MKQVAVTGNLQLFASAGKVIRGVVEDPNFCRTYDKSWDPHEKARLACGLDWERGLWGGADDDDVVEVEGSFAGGDFDGEIHPTVIAGVKVW